MVVIVTVLTVVVKVKYFSKNNSTPWQLMRCFQGRFSQSCDVFSIRGSISISCPGGVSLVAPTCAACMLLITFCLPTPGFSDMRSFEDFFSFFFHKIKIYNNTIAYNTFHKLCVTPILHYASIKDSTCNRGNSQISILYLPVDIWSLSVVSQNCLAS